MIVYILMLIIAVFFSYIANIKEDDNKIIVKRDGKTFINKNLIFWYASEIVLIFISGVRYNVGADYTYTYVPFFTRLLTGNVITKLEIGFTWLIKTIQLFTSNPAWMFIVCSVIFFHFIYKAIKEQSPNKPLSIFLLITTTYIFIFYNAMRQMMAISIFLYAIKFIKERNLKKFLVYMVIASSLHYSAVLLIIPYFLYGIKLTKVLTIVTIVVATVMQPLIVNLGLKIVSLTKYSNYINSKFDTAKKGWIVLSIDLAILLFVILFLPKTKKEIKDKDEISVRKMKDYSFYCILHIITTILAIYDGTIPLLNRLKFGTECSIIILIPYALGYIKNKKARNLMMALICLCYFVYFYYTIGVKNANTVLPYKTIFWK